MRLRGSVTDERTAGPAGPRDPGPSARPLEYLRACHSARSAGLLVVVLVLSARPYAHARNSFTCNMRRPGASLAEGLSPLRKAIAPACQRDSGQAVQLDRSSMLGHCATGQPRGRQRRHGAPGLDGVPEPQSRVPTRRPRDHAPCPRKPPRTSPGKPVKPNPTGTEPGTPLPLGISADSPRRSMLYLTLVVVGGAGLEPATSCM